MATLLARKRDVLNYILASIDEDDFDDGADLGFDDYRDFENYQRAVDGTDEYTLQTLEFLKNQVAPISNLMDKETMIEFPASGFAFNTRGEFVFVNEK